MIKYFFIFFLIVFSSSVFSRTLSEINDEVFSFQEKSPRDLRVVNRVWRELADYKIEALDPSQKRKEILLRSNLLIEVSKIRSKLIVDPTVDYPLDEMVHDSWIEIKIIPDRWTSVFRVKASSVEQKWSEGGLKNISFFIQELSVFFFIFLTPYLISKFTSFALTQMESFRQRRLKFSRGRRPTFAIFLQRINPYMPWIILLICLSLVKEILRHSLFSELNLFIPYIEYYCWYRIFRQLVVTTLRIVSEKAMLSHIGQTKERINKTAIFYGRFLFFYLVILHSVSSVASRGLLFKEVRTLAIIILILSLYTTFYKWSEEIEKVIKSYLSEESFSFLLKFKTKVLYPVIAPVFFIMALLLPFIDWLQTVVGEFELTKKLTAKIFKKKLESNERLETEEDLELPKDYLDHFSFKEASEENQIPPTDDPLERISLEIDEWRNEESDEHSLAIYGTKGAGKSTTLSRIEKKYHELSVVRSDVPSKLISRKEVFDYLGKLLFQKSIDDITEFIEYSRELPETLVLLDETQNFFLGKLGGFDGIKAFFEVLNLPTENIFWVASFNEFSWNYIEQVFSKSRYFRASIGLKGFSEKDLQKLIMSRHNKTSYKLSYSEIIKAMRSNDERDGYAYVESLFFRFLWEQSKGNPRGALHLWLSSLTPRKKGVFRVGLPSYPKISVLAELNSETHFVYASILKHENITTEQIIEVTAIEEGVVRHALKIGLENSFIERDKKGLYRATPKTQGSLISFLRSRNIIYG